MNKKIFIYGLGFVSIASLIIIAGGQIIETNNIIENQTTYVDFDNEFIYDEEFEEERETEYIKKENEVISYDNIKSSWYLAKIKDSDDNIDIIMIKMMANPDKFANGDIRYYYSNVFENANIVYASEYLKNTDEFLNESGPLIIGTQDLEKVLEEFNLVKDEYTKKELHNILKSIRKNYDNKKLNGKNAIVKAYNH